MGLRLDGGGTQEEELRKAVWDGEVVSALRAFCEQPFPVIRGRPGMNTDERH